MALDRTFLALTPKRVAAMIMNARRRAVYAAPGLTLEVAAALINAREGLGDDAVAVVVDVSEAVCRLGYGVVDALATFRERGLAVPHAPGLRVGFIVIDDEGFIFASTPLLVEESGDHDDQPNAIRASKDQIECLIAAVLPPISPVSTIPKTSAAVVQRAEIGQVVAAPLQIEKIEESIKVNPVENFDLRRIVNVFSTHFQFYEFQVVGTHVERRTVQLPKDLLGSIRDNATRDRITAAFKMLSKQNKVGEAIHKQSAMIRKRFIPHHPIYGGVILKTNRKALDADIVKLEKLIESHRNAVQERFDRDVRKSIADLVKAFWRDIARNPPPELIDQGITKPTNWQAKSYLLRKLADVFPQVEDLVDQMRVTPVAKDITWSTLNEKGFVDWLAKQWPDRSDLRQPFQLYRAARERVNPPNRVP
jgi:hypothetical protein